MFDFIKRRPATSTFLIGSALVIIWAVLSRVSGGGSSSSPDAGYVVNSNLPSPDAQLAASVALEQTRAEERSLSQQLEAQFSLALAQLGVQQTAQQLAADLDARQIDQAYGLAVLQAQSQTDQLQIQSILANAQDERDFVLAREANNASASLAQYTAESAFATSLLEADYRRAELAATSSYNTAQLQTVENASIRDAANVSAYQQLQAVLAGKQIDADTSLSLASFDVQRYIADKDYQAAKASADAQVQAAKKSKSKGLSIGPFSIRF